MEDDLSKYRVYADEPSIIYQVRMADTAGEFAPDDFGEECAAWLEEEYPACSFFYESDASTLFLDGGHGLSEEQIRLMQCKARSFVHGLIHGISMARKQNHVRRQDLN